MEITSRFAEMDNLAEVKAMLTKYRECDAINKLLPSFTEQLLIQCLEGIHTKDYVKKLVEG